MVARGSFWSNNVLSERVVGRDKVLETAADNCRRGIACASFLYYWHLNVTEIAYGTAATAVVVARFQLGFSASERL